MVMVISIVQRILQCIVLLLLSSETAAFRWDSNASSIATSLLGGSYSKHSLSTVNHELRSNKNGNTKQLNGLNFNMQWEESLSQIVGEIGEAEYSDTVSRRLRRMGKKTVGVDEDIDADALPSVKQSSSSEVFSGTSSSDSTSPDSSSSWEGSCPAGNPQGNLKVVSDITKELDHVELITDSHLAQRFKSPPKPVMSDASLLGPLCSKYAWRFCPNPKRGAEDKNWYTCEARQFVGKVHCAFIDNQKTIPGMVYDHERTYPVHGCHPHQKGFQPQPTKKVVRLDKVAHNLAVYPTGFAHVMAQLPRLIILAQSIPKDVPILLAKSGARDSFVKILHEKGILDKKRIMNWDPNTVYFAKTLYYAGEMGKGVGTGGKWDTLKVEFCSWALVMPRERLQRIFIGDYSKKNNQLLLQASESTSDVTNGAALNILVVHRKDASGGRRMIKNHNTMMTSIKSTFKNSKVIEFIGDKFSLPESIAAFSTADVVVAPHGAALGFLAFMRPGTSCVEIGYKDLKGMKFPAPYYMALALSVNVGYFLSMAEGGYGSPLTADVNDVVAVTKLAVAYASDPDAPHPNIY